MMMRQQQQQQQGFRDNNMKGKVRKPTGHQGNEWSMMPTPVTCTAPIVGKITHFLSHMIN